MATEIERRFLVTSERWREHVDGGTPMQQGYLSAQGERTVRVPFGTWSSGPEVHSS